MRDFRLQPQIFPMHYLISRNLDTVSPRREKRPYICGLRTRIECEPGGEHSTRSDRVTNIGSLLSSRASVLPNKLNSPSSYRVLRRVPFLRFGSHTPMPLLSSPHGMRGIYRRSRRRIRGDFHFYQRQVPVRA